MGTVGTWCTEVRAKAVRRAGALFDEARPPPFGSICGLASDEAPRCRIDGKTAATAGARHRRHRPNLGEDREAMIRRLVRYRRHSDDLPGRALCRSPTGPRT